MPYIIGSQFNDHFDYNEGMDFITVNQLAIDFHETVKKEYNGNNKKHKSFLKKQFKNFKEEIGDSSFEEFEEYFEELLDKRLRDFPFNCPKCNKRSDDIEERFSFGAYAGKFCISCCGAYRDNCGEGQPQGSPSVLESEGENYWEEGPTDLV